MSDVTAAYRTPGRLECHCFLLEPLCRRNTVVFFELLELRGICKVSQPEMGICYFLSLRNDYEGKTGTCDMFNPSSDLQKLRHWLLL